MKRSELEAVGTGCKEHPNTKRQPGVCSSCLRDKLSKLYDNKVNKPTYPFPCSPSSSASPQPFSSSNYVSPAYRRRHRRHASYMTDSISSMTNFNYVLMKSNSVAFVSSNQLREREVNGDYKRSKKDGFWSKLLKLTRKDKNEAFTHSRTMRERSG